MTSTDEPPKGGGTQAESSDTSAAQGKPAPPAQGQPARPAQGKPAPPAAPLWRQAFDAADRAVAPRAENLVRTEAFEVGMAMVRRAQVLARDSVRGLSARAWHLLNLPAGTDVNRLRAQIGALDREVRRLTVRLETERRRADLPTSQPSPHPTDQPTSQPSPHPTDQPTSHQTSQPTEERDADRSKPAGRPRARATRRRTQRPSGS